MEINIKSKEEKKTVVISEGVLISFHKWMINQGWELHSSGNYWFKLEDRSEWPPKEENVCDEKQLIEKFKTFCMENCNY